MIHFLEQTIAVIDFNMPWILPGLEIVESFFPLPLRLLAAAALSLYLAWTRQRHDDGVMRVPARDFWSTARA